MGRHPAEPGAVQVVEDDVEGEDLLQYVVGLVGHGNDGQSAVLDGEDGDAALPGVDLAGEASAGEEISEGGELREL